MIQTIIWHTLHSLICILFLVQAFYIYKVKDGNLRKVFLCFSLVAAHYFFAVAFYDDLGVSESGIQLLSAVPIFVVLITALYVLRDFIRYDIELVVKKVVKKNKKQC